MVLMLAGHPPLLHLVTPHCSCCLCVGLPICPSTKGVPRSAVKSGHLFISQAWFMVMLNAISGEKSPGYGKGADNSICLFLNFESVRAPLLLNTPHRLPGESPSSVYAEAL